ncbi:hypothetical protein [Dyadobacter sp. CY312]|uniref:hypothetical protein n=1 Tax=Dyadobacter sp. CY312 TaxID=2907303 RepID=UPI00286E8866|nr:hypothetical protein [Dyadobacter sp. CY312]
MKNGQTVIGLFQGMFDKNMLTFNPGWNQDKESLDEFTDVRKIASQLSVAGIPLNETPKGENGPAYIMLTDLDGNPILIDQHR